MAGIYIHIPFCKQACHYCDFHFSTNQSYKDLMIETICKEIELQKDYLFNQPIGTIYFGGGTPSLLNHTNLSSLLNTVYKQFQVDPQVEITLEANPDDLNLDYIKELPLLGINRLSVGIQSFNNDNLKYLNRTHTGNEAERSIKLAQEYGINNISLDLIYGIAAADHKIWLSDLQTAISLNVPHISAYCLTIEPNTVFGKWLKTNRIQNVDDEFSAFQFELLTEQLEMAGFEQYEISNFGKPNFYSIHNNNYWKKIPYLGVGPSAHSYNIISRQYNLSHNHLYLEKVNKGELHFTKEILSEKDLINEHIMLGLRTSSGCNIDFLKNKFNFELLKNTRLDFYFSDNYMYLSNGNLILTKKGKLLADKITFDLFLE